MFFLWLFHNGQRSEPRPATPDGVFASLDLSVQVEFPWEAITTEQWNKVILYFWPYLKYTASCSPLWDSSHSLCLRYILLISLIQSWTVAMASSKVCSGGGVASLADRCGGRCLGGDRVRSPTRILLSTLSQPTGTQARLRCTSAVPAARSTTEALEVSGEVWSCTLSHVLYFIQLTICCNRSKRYLTPWCQLEEPNKNPWIWPNLNDKSQYKTALVARPWRGWDGISLAVMLVTLVHHVDLVFSLQKKEDTIVKFCYMLEPTFYCCWTCKNCNRSWCFRRMFFPICEFHTYTCLNGFAFRIHT